MKKMYSFTTSLCLLLIVVVALLVACAPAAPEPSRPKAELPAISRPPGQGEWAKITNEARKEGTVVVLADHSAALRAALSEPLKKSYGLDLEWTSGSGAELTRKLFAERNAGIYRTDIYLAGHTSIVFDLKPGGLLKSLGSELFLPEVADPKVWWKGEIPFVDEGKTHLANAAYPSTPLSINTDLVKEAEIQSYRDLINPRWKGRIAMHDPTVPGPGLQWFYNVGAIIMNLDFMRELAKLEPTIQRDRRLNAEGLARGKFAIGIANRTEQITELRSAGAPVKSIVPTEGTYVVGGPGFIALFNRNDHPNAARVFFNWFLSREGQTIYSKISGSQSMRVDIPTDHLVEVRQSNVKYVNTLTEESQRNMMTYPSIAREIFGHLMR